MTERWIARTLRARTVLAGAVLLVAAAAAGDSGRSGTDPENTGRNVRDRDGNTVTVFDQGNSGPDLEITAKIRKAIVEDDSLSMNAHNVKVITKHAVVHLRGPVDTAAEKASIDSKARSVSGVKKVVNQLEVDTD